MARSTPGRADGGFRALAVIHVQFGPPITPAEIATLSDDQLVQVVEARIRAVPRAGPRGRLRAAGVTAS